MTFTTIEHPDETKGEHIAIKTDRLGRIKLSRDHREALLNEFDSGEMSGIQFAKLHGINYTTFANWRQNRNKLKRKSKAAKPRSTRSESPQSFSEVEVTQQAKCRVALHVKLSHGETVQMHQVEQAPLLAALIKSLA